MRGITRGLLVLGFVAAAADAAAQCTKDTDCKGSRICNRGACVEPPGAPPPAAAPRATPSPVDPQLDPLPPEDLPPPAAPPAAAPPAAAPAAPPAGGLPGVGALPPPAAKRPAAWRGFQLALRTGYAHPFGKLTDATGDSMAEAFSGQMPLVVDAGVNLGRGFFVGGYFGLGLGAAAGAMADTCEDITCVAVSVRLGILAQLNFRPGRSVSPWVGVGSGLEVNMLAMSGPGGSGTFTALGAEFLQLLFGVDFRLTRGIGIGPFLSFSVGTYTDVSLELNGDVDNYSIENPALHEWLMLGVRVVFFR